jgi:hypothetical protein
VRQGISHWAPSAGLGEQLGGPSEL